MRVTVLGTRPLTTAIRDLASRVARPVQEAVAVQRRAIPYWQERGWTQQGNVFTGNYQTPFGVFQGSARETSGRIEFALKDPPPELEHHTHWTCFRRLQNGWWTVHMAVRPKELSAGILAIEGLLAEAIRQARSSA